MVDIKKTSVKKAMVTMDQMTAFDKVARFIEEETIGLTPGTIMQYNITAQELRDAIDTIRYYILTAAPNARPLPFEYSYLEWVKNNIQKEDTEVAKDKSE